MNYLEAVIKDFNKNISVLPIIIGVSVVLLTTVVANCLWNKSSKKNSKKLVILVDPKTKHPSPLSEKEDISYDTRRFQVELPSSEHAVGLQIGQQIYLSAKISDELVIKTSTPFLSDDEKGYVDLVVKVQNENLNEAGMNSDTAVTSSLPSSFITAILGSRLFRMLSSSTTDGDSPLEIQSVSSSGDSNAKSNTQDSTMEDTLKSVSSTSPIENKSSYTSFSFKRPVLSSSPAAQNLASLTTQPNSKKNRTFDKKKELAKARNKYYSNLKGLNESVSNWIAKQVENNPLCFLSAIFKEYEKYLKDIQEKYEAAKQEIDDIAISERSEVQMTFDYIDGETSLFRDKFACSSQDTKTNAKSFINTTQATAAGNTNTTNTDYFGTTSNASAKQPSPSRTPIKGVSLTTPCVTDTNSPLTTNAENASSRSQCFTSGINLTSPATSTSSALAPTNTNVGSPPRGFSFGISLNAITSPIKLLSYTNAATTSRINLSSYTNAANTGSPAKGFSLGFSTDQRSTSSTNSLSAIGAATFTEGMNEDADQPPKVDSTPVIEENSVYDTTFKILVKKYGNSVDTKIGKVEESVKHPILFDTSISCADATHGQEQCDAGVHSNPRRKTTTNSNSD